MSVAENRDRGLDVEDEACQRYPVEPASDARDDWHDLEFTADLELDVVDDVLVEKGTLAESKSCYDHYRDRRGRWWIRRGAHEQLLDADGVYLLSVVDRDTGGVLRTALVEASTVDQLIDRWWDCGNGGQTAKQYRQLPWSKIFVSLSAPGRDD